ncbi:MAG: hypothetical protein O6940_05925 [Ignavibacteria bacterium]|nr:hypothetical protein [Ignavibacteria bacterium]
MSGLLGRDVPKTVIAPPNNGMQLTALGAPQLMPKTLYVNNMLLESSKEKITSAKLYRAIGKFDSVFTIIIDNKSELIKELGSYINATLVYSKDEREKYEKNNDDFINTFSKGVIKIKIIIPDLDVKQKLKYELDGIRNSTAHSGIFDSNEAKNGGARKQLAAKLWDLEHQTYLWHVRSVLKYVVSNELNNA